MLLDARIILSLLIALTWAAPSGAAEEPFTSFIAQASAEHPRNSEGDIIVLRDGTLFAAWSQFYGGAEDHAAARIVAVKSTDGGRTWGSPTTIQENHGGANVMSVSLLRSASGDVLFFYLIKNSLSDLKAYVRRSKDDTQSWSEPTLITPEPGYHVMNNARIIQLRSGRLLAPISTCGTVFAKGDPFRTVVYRSDDDGRTWQRGRTLVSAPKRGAMEPGLIEMKDGRVMQIIRTQTGYIWHSYSSDGGDTWTEAQPWIVEAPESPTTITRIPGTGDWLLVLNPTVEWKNPEKTVLGTNHGGARTPLSAMISHDEGKTWSRPKNIESDPSLTFAYTSITPHQDRMLLSYYVFPLKGKQLSLKFQSIPLDWLMK
ncbi:MAG: exo-alpha-sialidase [Verrucomicrobiaceae bacterium]|nr:exo-alpha-sialidase [Verrucomicrobiaceae bacterium]